MKKLIILVIAVLITLPSLLQSQGCIEVDTDARFTLIGYLQPQADYQFLGDDHLGNSLDQSSFYFNRARLGFTGAIPYDFSYYFLTEFSPTLGGPFILDAFVSYNRFAPFVKASIGQFKSPFGLELMTPCHKLHTINRSEVVTNLSHPFRDMGLMLFGGTGDLGILGSKTENFLGYNLAIMNGTGLNLKDNNHKKDIVARVTLHPFKFLTLGSSYRFGKHPTQVAGITEDDEKARMGFDLEFKLKGFLVQGEYITGADKGSYTTGGGCGGEITTHVGSVDRSGYFVQAAYMTPWNIQPVFKIENYDPNMANDIIEAPESIDDIQNIMTFGVNYFFNERTRFQINYLYKAEESAKVEVDNDELLVQFQIVF